MPFKCQMEELKIKFAFVEETIVTRGLIVSIITATYNKCIGPLCMAIIDNIMYYYKFYCGLNVNNLTIDRST